MGRRSLVVNLAVAAALAACSSQSAVVDPGDSTTTAAAPVLDGSLDCTTPSRWSHVADFARNATGPLNVNQALEEALFPYGMAFDGRPLITGTSASLVVGDREIVIATAVQLARGWGITELEGCEGYGDPPGVPPLKLACSEPRTEQMDSEPVDDGWAAARDMLSAQPDEYVVEPRPGAYAVVGSGGPRAMAVGVWNAGQWTLDHTETC